MNSEEARTILRSKIAEYSKLAHAHLKAKIGQDEHFEVIGATGTVYQVEVQVFWDAKPSGNIRVLVSIDDGGLRAFKPICEDFLSAE